MDEVFIGFFEDEKYGKLSKYIDNNGKITFYRIIKLDTYTVNEELTDEENEEMLSRLANEGDNLL